MKEMTSLKARTAYLTEQYALNQNAAIALQLSELGYSNSGIAEKLGVTASTVDKYQIQAEEQIGAHVWEALPKSRRYDTFPSDKDEDNYAGDNIEYSDYFQERVKPLTEGSVNWNKIGDEHITLDV